MEVQSAAQIREQREQMSRLDEMQSRLEAQHNAQREALMNGTRDSESRQRWLQCAEGAGDQAEDQACTSSISDCNGARPLGLCSAEV